MVASLFFFPTSVLSGVAMVAQEVCNVCSIMLPCEDSGRFAHYLWVEIGRWAPSTQPLLRTVTAPRASRTLSKGKWCIRSGWCYFLSFWVLFFFWCFVLLFFFFFDEVYTQETLARTRRELLTKGDSNEGEMVHLF